MNAKRNNRQRRQRPGPAGLRERLRVVIFGTDTTAGKTFDIALLVAIFTSVAAVMVESAVPEKHAAHQWLVVAEWVFTILFTIEYGVRLYCVHRPWRYAVSFFGVVDLLAVVPTYLSLVVAGSQSLMVIRTLRLVRVFRVFQLGRYLKETRVLMAALRATAAKIVVFLVVIVTIVMILGSAMYLIEGPDRGFTSIPKAVYWAIVTVTTVGYGDIAPKTPAGQSLAAVAMILGYSIIIVPTGIFSSELIAQIREEDASKHCPGCGRAGHATDAVYCKYCSDKL